MLVLSGHRASLTFFLAILFTSISFTLADEFTSPSNSEADLAVHYTLGETVIVTWETSLSVLSLYVAHWGGSDVGSLLTDATNPNVFVWTIGESDNINAQLLSGSSNYVLIIRDPSGQTTTGNGFINGELQSRGFVISASNSSSSSSSSTSSSTVLASTSPTAFTSSSSSLTTSTVSTTPTFASTSKSVASTPSSSATSVAPASAISTNAKIGIGVGAGVGGIALIALGVAVAILLRRQRRQKREAAQQHATVPSEDKYSHNPPSQYGYDSTANKHASQPTYKPTVVNELSDTSSQPQTRYELGSGR